MTLPLAVFMEDLLHQCSSNVIEPYKVLNWKITVVVDNAKVMRNTNEIGIKAGLEMRQVTTKRDCHGQGKKSHPKRSVNKSTGCSSGMPITLDISDHTKKESRWESMPSSTETKLPLSPMQRSKHACQKESRRNQPSSREKQSSTENDTREISLQQQRQEYCRKLEGNPIPKTNWLSRSHYLAVRKWIHHNGVECLRFDDWSLG